MVDLKKRFKKRAQRVRAKIAKVSHRYRVSIHKSNKNIYAQIIKSDFDTTKNVMASKTIAYVSTLTNISKDRVNANRCNKVYAEALGIELAKKAIEAGVSKVVLDRGGYQYHGIVKVFADALRSASIEL